MFRSRFLLAGWRTRLADIASIAFIASLAIATLVLLGGPAHPPLEHTRWQVESVEGQHVAQADSNQSWLQLSPGRDKLQGAINGRALDGDYQQVGVPRQLRLNPHSLSASDKSAQNRRYIAALRHTRGETIEGTRLVLRDANGRALASLRAVQPG